MGILLMQVVEHIRKSSKGLANVDLARLNIRTGKPLSRMAAVIPDDKQLVDNAWRVAHEILREQEGGKNG